MNKIADICKVEGCGKKYHAHGYCYLHAGRFKRHGDPLKTTRTPNGIALPWLERQVIDPGNDCIIWPFGMGKHGYGVCQYEGKVRTAHRIALILHTGIDPKGMDVAHGPCHNRKCVNPLHLRWATRLENVKDMERDGSAKRGEKSHSSKLSDADFIEISNTQLPPVKGGQRKLLYVQISEKYGISTEYVSKIMRGKAERCINND